MSNSKISAACRRLRLYSQRRAAVFLPLQAAMNGSSTVPMSWRATRSAMSSNSVGSAHGVLGHGLAERHGRGLDVAAAVGAIGRPAVRFIERAPDPVELIALGAVETGRVRGIAVQLHHAVVRHAGSLVQVVDVLRDDARRLAGAEEARQGAMTAP